MLDIFLDAVKKILKSRLFPITLIYFALFFVIIHQLFVLQIVQGPELAKTSDFRTTKSREIKSTRGNVYDRNGKLLASNILSYSVTMEDSTDIVSNEQRNMVVDRLIKIIEKNGDTLNNEFYIIKNADGNFEFTIEGEALTRFKKNVYAYVLVDNELTEAQQNATAKEVYDFLLNGTGDDYTDMFGITGDYTGEEILKIMGVRYALFCNYPKYLQITIASKLSDTTVAAISESSADLPGVEIQQQTKRVYNDSLYFAHILGYTGMISSDELINNEAIKNEDGTDYYNSTDIVGKTGIEKKFEDKLGGKKGSEIVAVNTSGKVIDTVEFVEPVAGNDIYLTIDSNLQIATYHLLEKEIAKILISKIEPDMNYGSKGESASKITIPIYEVYFALINNNIIDIKKFDDKGASQLERQVYGKYQSKLSNVFSQLDNLLSINNTITNNKAGEMEDYLNYFYTALVDNNILLEASIPEDDTTYQSYLNDKISLSSFLQYAIHNNWVDLSKLNVGTEYFSADEHFTKLINYTKGILEKDGKFNKKIYRTLVFSYNLSGTEISLLLFDQGVLEYNEGDEKDARFIDFKHLKNGKMSSYDFMMAKLKSLEITPAMLALDPCSGSVVVTDVKTGVLLALVTYPSFDNNKLANKVDSAYYSKLIDDKSLPLRNRPTMQRTAPGSTFKMVTSFAALEENVVAPSETIYDLGIFEKSQPPAKCHIYPGSHGAVNIVDALKVSCNYFFYEMGWRLSIDGNGKFNEDLGLQRLATYAELFGLNTTSGIELSEADPEISNDDPVRSAIGQGSNDYTPVQLSRYITTLANNGTCFNLTILDKILNKDGQTVLDNSATILNDLTKIKSSTWDAVHQGMFSAINVQGGSVVSLFKNLGVTVAGKTGTSQLSLISPNNALFLSYAPYQDPEISITAVIPSGYTSFNAAELSSNIYKLYFNLEDPEKLVEGEVTVPETNIDAVSE